MLSDVAASLHGAPEMRNGIFYFILIKVATGGQWLLNWRSAQRSPSENFSSRSCVFHPNTNQPPAVLQTGHLFVPLGSQPAWETPFHAQSPALFSPPLGSLPGLSLRSSPLMRVGQPCSSSTSVRRATSVYVLTTLQRLGSLCPAQRTAHELGVNSGENGCSGDS